LVFFEEKMLHMVEVTLPFHGEGQAVDELAQELWVKILVHLNNVLHGSWEHGPSLDLGNKGAL
jgi:hypothetical protein